MSPFRSSTFSNLQGSHTRGTSLHSVLIYMISACLLFLCLLGFWNAHTPSSSSSVPESTPVSHTLPSETSLECTPVSTLPLVTSSDAAPPPVKYITKSIQDIVPGDRVYATDPETVLCRVTQTFVNTAYELHRLTTVSDSDDPQTFGVTAGHPYFVLLQNDTEYDQNLRSRAVRFADDEYEYSTDVSIENRATNNHNGYYVAASDLIIGDRFIGPNGEVSTVCDNRFGIVSERYRHL